MTEFFDTNLSKYSIKLTPCPVQEIAEQRSTTKKSLDRADSADDDEEEKKKRRKRRRQEAGRRRRRSAAFQESRLARATIGRGLYTEEDLLSDILG